jgi:hypothetical protein
MHGEFGAIGPALLWLGLATLLALSALAAAKGWGRSVD